MGMPMIVGAHSTDEVQFALDTASALAEGFCERQFAFTDSDTVTIDPYFGHVKAMPAIPPMSAYGSYPGYGVSFSSYGNPYIGQAMLPNPPVTGVSMVLAQLPMVAGGEPGWVELVNYGWDADGFIWDTSGMPGVALSDGGPVPSWPRMPRSLQITYSHGFVLPGTDPAGDAPELPAAIVNAVIKAAAQILVNPADVASYSAGIISTNFHSLVAASSGPAGAILDDMLLAPYRLVNL